MEERIELLCEVRGRAGVITLNRPEVLNSLNLSMLSAMHRQLRDWAADARVDAVVVRGAGARAFCAGGDVRAVYDARGNDAFMDRVYRIEYQLDEYISRYPKPYVALMSGYTMGGGCGISIHGKHRVVTESSVIAMPEVAIGLFPDVNAELQVDFDTLASGMTAADVIPNPPRTHFIRTAQERGCRVIDGLGMLVNQGVIGVKLWTGIDPDPAVMRAALVEVFGA